jgi:hypothetical protein
MSYGKSYARIVHNNQGLKEDSRTETGCSCGRNGVYLFGGIVILAVSFIISRPSGKLRAELTESGDC